MVVEDVQLKLDKKGHGFFYINEGEDRLGEMEIGIAGDHLTAYHTEVAPKAEGKGLAKQLLASMVDHARRHSLKVTALCPYVHAQFRRHPEAYADIWDRGRE